MKKTALITVVFGAGLLLIGTGAQADKSSTIRLNSQTAAAQPISPSNSAEIEKQEETSGVKNPAAGEEINWQVLSGGGITDCSGGGYRLGGTIGQLAAGVSSATGQNLYHGFWQSFGASDCDCFPADANADLVIDVGDAVYIMNYIFREGPPAMPYEVCSGDAQADCLVNIGDVVYIINYVFREGPYTYSCETWVGSCGPGIYK